MVWVTRLARSGRGRLGRRGIPSPSGEHSASSSPAGATFISPKPGSHAHFTHVVTQGIVFQMCDCTPHKPVQMMHA